MSDTNNFFKKEDLERVKLSFKRVTLKQSLTFFAFILLASILWGLQIKNQNINIPMNFHVNYENINNDIIFDNSLPQNIEVYLKDKGSSFGHYFKSDKDTIDIDIASYLSSDKVKPIITDAELESLIKAKVLPTSEIISKKPSFINLSFHLSQNKKVPVKFDGVLKLAIGYQLEGKIEIIPNEILIKGTKAGIDTIDAVYTMKDTIVDIKDNETRVLKLQPITGITLVPDIVKLEIPAEEFVQKSFQVPIDFIAEKKDVSVSFFPSSVTISFFISNKYMNIVKAEDFKIKINYKDLVNKTETSSINIDDGNIEYPSYVRIQSIEPHYIEFIMMDKKN